jgi:hypothetical protein
MIGIKRPVTERERQQLSRVRIVPKPPISLDCAVWRITAFLSFVVMLVRRDPAFDVAVVFLLSWIIGELAEINSRRGGA